MTSNKNAMLVRLGISQWYNKTTDKNVTKEISDKYGEESTTDDHYVKVLLPKNAMAKVNKTIGRMRVAHYKMTLPWEDGGLRILPAKMYFTYTQTMGLLKEEFAREVDNFLKSYRAFKDEAKEKKKGLYNEADYPQEAALRGFFEVRTSFYPLPDSGDFRLDTDPETAANIAAQAQSEFDASVQASTAYLRKRMGLLLENFYQATSNPKKKFHATTVVNLYDFVETIDNLNIGKDEVLVHIAGRVVAELCPFSCDSIKEDPALREELSHITLSILHELKAAP